MNQVELPSLHQPTFDHFPRRSPLSAPHAAGLGFPGPVAAPPDHYHVSVQAQKAHPSYNKLVQDSAQINGMGSIPRGTPAAANLTPMHNPASGPTLLATHDISRSTSPQKYPMAAPTLPASVQQPDSPKSPGHQVRERERVALLLDLNAELIRELSDLQSSGKGGAISAQQAAQNNSQGLSDRLASDEFVQTIVRFQANLAYLYNQPEMQGAGQAQSPIGKKGPAHPPHFMRHPPHMPQLADKYARLRQLFPGWAGRDASQSQVAAEPK